MHYASYQVVLEPDCEIKYGSTYCYAPECLVLAGNTCSGSNRRNYFKKLESLREGRSACFLEWVSFDNIQEADGYAQCNIYQSAGHWWVMADAKNNDEETHAQCQASCIWW
ncbi:MAG: hypothetical protein KC713_08675 [Candidatus Omnitrophica bacterium]|nr:hypothetical protein [Candidatus Omnitrophota bacterium]